MCAKPCISQRTWLLRGGQETHFTACLLQDAERHLCTKKGCWYDHIESLTCTNSAPKRATRSASVTPFFSKRAKDKAFKVVLPLETNLIVPCGRQAFAYALPSHRPQSNALPCVLFLCRQVCAAPLWVPQSGVHSADKAPNSAVQSGFMTLILAWHALLTESG